MSISYYQSAVSNSIHVLQNLDHLLDLAVTDAAARKIDETVLLQARLFPTMFPLIRQVRIACDVAKLGTARLTGIPAPVFEDDEQSFAQLKERIAKTIAHLKTVPESAFVGCAERPIELPHRPNKLFSAPVVLQKFMQPNLYFHVMTVYNILRHNGVAVGKNDYLGELS